MKKAFISMMVLAGMLCFSAAEAVETKLVIRAKSKDAKFVGTKMGGAMVVVKESETGRVLVEGLTSGGTGDTRKIMVEPKTRFGHIAGGAAMFETSVNIDEPTLVTIEVKAPYAAKPNMIKSSTEMWLIPGKDITGEGIVIEVPGFSIDARTPERVSMAQNRAAIPIQAHIVMI